MSAELDPQARRLLDGPLRITNPNAVPELSRLRQANPVMDYEVVGPGEHVFRTWDSTVLIEGREVPLRWYQPTMNLPELWTVFVHGGGWVNGTLASYDALCRSLSLRTGGGVVSVGYTLSPEARYPVALIEVEHILANVPELPGSVVKRDTRLAAAGDSAGANLLGGALHRLATYDMSPITDAVFIYPVTDTSLDYDSWRRIGSRYNPTETRMRWYWEQYLGEQWNTRTVPPDASILYSDQLRTFPRNLVITASHDPLQDEGEALVRSLQKGGVDAEHLAVPGQIHGFLRFRRALTDPNVGADAIMDRIGAWLRNNGED